MKKTMRFGAATLMSAMALTMSAGITDTGKHLTGEFSILNERLTAGNSPLFIFNDYQDEEEGDGEYQVYDTNFALVKKFTIPAPTELTATYTVYEAIRGPIGIQVGNAYNAEYDDWTSQMVENEYGTSLGYRWEEKENETWIYSPLNQGNYYYEEIYGTAYPRDVRIWNPSTGILKVLSYEYVYDDWGFTGQYSSTPRTETQEVTPHPYWIQIYSDAVESGEGFLTQTLFNKDDSFEWIMPKYEKVSVDYQSSYEKVTGENWKETGFKVVSESGKEVADITYPFNAAEIYDSNSFELLMTAEHYYLMASLDIRVADDHTQRYRVVYEVSQEGNSVQMVGQPIKVSVAPTLVGKGVPVKVDLGMTAGERCRVMVTDMSGRIVRTQAVEPGTTGASIATDSFASGIYIVKVSDGNTLREATRIVVR